MIKKEYLVTVPVTANGTQTFLVEAASPKAAIDVVGNCGGTWLSDDFDIQNFKIDQAKAEENK